MTIHNAGSLNIDDVFCTSHIVRPGETIPSSTLKRYAGGKGLNQSTALVRSGANTRHIGRIGEDGIFLKKGLENDGVDVQAIEAGQVPTGHAIIQVADDGENAIVLYGGANQEWSDRDIDRVLAGAEIGDVLLLQNEINGIPELMVRAAAEGLRIAMNPAPMGPEVRNFPLNMLDWLVVNEIEGRELSGLDLDDSGNDYDDEAIAIELYRLYPNAVIILTLGKRGAIRIDDKGLIRTCFPDVGPVVDTTGAGDTFMGYWLAGEVEGLSPERGLRKACAAGALAVTRSGAATGIPFLKEVEALLAI